MVKLDKTGWIPRRSRTEGTHNMKRIKKVNEEGHIQTLVSVEDSIADEVLREPSSQSVVIKPTGVSPSKNSRDSLTVVDDSNLTVSKDTTSVESVKVKHNNKDGVNTKSTNINSKNPKGVAISLNNIQRQMNTKLMAISIPNSDRREATLSKIRTSDILECYSRVVTSRVISTNTTSDTWLQLSVLQQTATSTARRIQKLESNKSVPTKYTISPLQTTTESCAKAYLEMQISSKTYLPQTERYLSLYLDCCFTKNANEIRLMMSLIMTVLPVVKKPFLKIRETTIVAAKQCVRSVSSFLIFMELVKHPVTIGHLTTTLFDIIKELGNMLPGEDKKYRLGELFRVSEAFISSVELLIRTATLELKLDVAEFYNSHILPIVELPRHTHRCVGGSRLLLSCSPSIPDELVIYSNGYIPLPLRLRLTALGNTLSSFKS